MRSLRGWRKLWSVRFFPLEVFHAVSRALAAEALAISVEAPMGNARDAAGKDAFGARERTRRSVRLDEGDRGRAFGIAPLPKKLWRTGKPVQFPGALGWTFLFLLSAQLRYAKSMRIVVLEVLFSCLIPVGWGCSWRVLRKVRIDRTSRGSGCQGGLGGKLHRICVERAGMFPSFLNFPPDSVLRPEFWIIFFVFIPYHPKEFQFFRCLQLSRMLGT